MGDRLIQGLIGRCEESEDSWSVRSIDSPTLLLLELRMPGPSSFGIAAFGCHLRAAASCQDGYDVLNRYVFPSLPRLTESEANPDLSIEIEKSGDQVSLLVNGAQIAAAGQPVGLVPHLIHQIDESIVHKLTAFRAVHAGAVQLRDQVLLLPGRTHSGKSSMVAELLRRGATYLSDEYALIDAEGQAHPYPRPLLLRNGGPSQTALLPQDCPASIATGPAPIGWIMELRYDDAEGWNVVAVPQSQGLLILLRHTPHVLAEAPDLLDKFQRAAAHAQCFTGSRMDAARAAEEILRLTTLTA